jgi:UDP-glucose 4-epimerase
MSSVKTILITGVLGYIDSHTVAKLFNKEYIKKIK